MATLTLTNKDTAILTFTLRHGKEPTVGELANFTFNDVIFPDGTLVKDLTFAQLQDQVWTYENKANATLTFPTKS